MAAPIGACIALEVLSAEVVNSTSDSVTLVFKFEGAELIGSCFLHNFTLLICGQIIFFSRQKLRHIF